MTVRVIIADDHAPFRAVAAELCALIPDVRVVSVAGTGAETIEQVRELRPQAVLLDVHLPDVDGFAVCALLRRELSDCRVVLCSVRDEPDYPARAAAAGGWGFVAKNRLTVATLRDLLSGL